MCRGHNSWGMTEAVRLQINSKPHWKQSCHFLPDVHRRADMHARTHAHTRLHTEVQTKLPATLFCCTHGWDDLLSWFAFAHMHTQKQAWKIKHMRYRSEHGCAQSIYRTPPPTQITQVSFIVSWWYAISVLQMFFLIYFSQASHTFLFYFFYLSKWKEVELLLAYTVKKQCWGLKWWHLCGRLY